MGQQIKILQILEKEYPHAKYYLNFSSPLDLTIAAILSAQARDEIVNETTAELFKKYRTAKDYSRARMDDLVHDIKEISFAGNKAKNIIGTCKILVEKYKGNVPDKMDELVGLPGVGRKTANVILINAFNVVEGIPCDTHVLRLGYRLGWTKSKNPDKVEQNLMILFDKKYWKEIPHLLKAHGRAVCKAPVPDCNRCVLKGLCPKIGVTERL